MITNTRFEPELVCIRYLFTFTTPTHQVSKAEIVVNLTTMPNTYSCYLLLNLASALMRRCDGVLQACKLNNILCDR